MTDDLLPHDAALERLHAFHPQKIDLTLGRVERLCAALRNPERKLPPVIHIAGTNGKGSTTAFMRAIAEAAGLKVHVLTSPHLVRFYERIRVAGTLITDAYFNEVLAHIEQVNDNQPITFFEITTVLAFQAFANIPADLCLIEVGLGGTYDATNVIPAPEVAVITPIDFDHQQFLGNTITAIAGEKAGIIKPGTGAVISAPQLADAQTVIENTAAMYDVPLTFAPQDYPYPAPSLAGPHQIQNACTAIAAMKALNDPRITEDAIARGLTSAVWPARMQHLTQGPLAAKATQAGADLWLDGAHNPHGARALATTLKEWRDGDNRPVHLILGMLASKDASGVLEALKPHIDQLNVTGFSSKTAADPALLAEAAAALGIKATTFPNVSAAVDHATQHTGTQPHIVIAGSLYLAGEVLHLSSETWPS